MLSLLLSYGQGMFLRKYSCHLFMKMSSKTTINSNVITSFSNEKVKLIKNLEDSSKARSKNNLVKLEGHRQVLDAIKNGFIPQLILYTDKAISNANNIITTSKMSINSATGTETNYHQQLMDILTNYENVFLSQSSSAMSTYPQINQVTEEIMKSLVDTVTNQGVVAAFQKPTIENMNHTNYLIDLYHSKIQSIQKNKSKVSNHSVVTQNSNLLILVLDGVSDPGNAGYVIIIFIITVIYY